MNDCRPATAPTRGSFGSAPAKRERGVRTVGVTRERDARRVGLHLRRQPDARLQDGAQDDAARHLPAAPRWSRRQPRYRGASQRACRQDDRARRRRNRARRDLRRASRRHQRVPERPCENTTSGCGPGAGGASARAEAVNPIPGSSSYVDSGESPASAGYQQSRLNTRSPRDESTTTDERRATGHRCGSMGAPAERTTAMQHTFAQRGGPKTATRSPIEMKPVSTCGAPVALDHGPPRSRPDEERSRNGRSAHSGHRPMKEEA